MPLARERHPSVSTNVVRMRPRSAPRDAELMAVLMPWMRASVRAVLAYHPDPNAPTMTHGTATTLVKAVETVGKHQAGEPFTPMDLLGALRTADFLMLERNRHSGDWPAKPRRKPAARKVVPHA